MTHRTQLRSGLLAVLVVVSLVALGGVGVAQDAPSQSPDGDVRDGVAESVSDVESIEGTALGTADGGAASGADGATPTYRLDFAANGTYSFGVPGPTDQTVGDLFVDDLAFAGVVYAYDADADRWTQVSGSEDVDALDAFVVRTQEPTAAVVRFADDAANATDDAAAELQPGLNHVSATQQRSVGTAFGVDGANVSAVVDPAALERPTVSPGAADDFERVNGSDDVVVDPFAGYFVDVDADGTLTSAASAGQDHESASDALNVSAPLPDPYFEVDVVDASTASLPGATHHVTAEITNVGPRTLTQSVGFRYDGTVVEERSISLAANESLEQTFQVDTTGTPVGASDLAVETALDRATETSEVRPERTVETQAPEPGDAVTVTVDATIEERRTVVLTERFGASVDDSTLQSVTVDGQNVTPTVTEGSSDSQTVVLSDVDAGDLSISYELDLRDDHRPGQALPFANGSTLALEDGPDADGEAVAVGGDQSVDLAQPPAFDVEIVDTDVETVAGATQTVEVEAENVDANGTGVVEFDYGDGLSEQFETLELATGETGTVTFEVDTTAKPIGSYEVAVDGGNSSDATTATVLAERSVDADAAAPGETRNVTVDAVVRDSETVVLNERFEGPVADAAVTSVRVDGNESFDDVTVSDADGDAVTVVFEDLEYGPVEVAYEVTLAEDASPDTDVSFGDDSFVVVEDAYGNEAEVDVGGDDAVDVTSDEAYFDVAAVRPAGTSVVVGEEQAVTANVTNVGGAAATQNVTYRATDENGTVVQTETFTGVQLEPDNSTAPPAEFDAAGLSPGDYEVVYESEDDSASATITVVENVTAGEVAGEVEADVVAPGANVTVDVAVVADGENASTNDTSVTLTADSPAATYVLPDVPAGENYSVTAEAQGYAGDVADDVDVVPGETADVDLDLQRLTGDAEVAVVDNATGAAVENATVELHQFDDQNATDVAETDANGSAALDALPAGEHTLAVAADGYEDATATVDVDAGTTTSVTVDLDALAAGALEVTDVDANASVVGTDATIDVGVENVGDLAATQELALDVGNGTVVQNESISLAGGETTTESFVVDTTALSPGDYEIEAATADDAAEATITVVADQPDTGDVAGDVTLDVVDPDANATVTVTVVETGDEETVTLEGTTATAAYSFDDLEADQNYTVAANASGYDEATADAVGVDANTTTERDLALQRQTGTASVTVAENASGDAVENATVDVGAFGDDDSTIASERTDANGSVDLQDLPVGEHAVAVDADGYDAASATIDVDADATTSATVALDALDQAAFQIDDVDANATVVVGQNYTVAVEVRNVGDLAGTHELSLDVGNDTVVRSESISLDGGASTTETFVVDTTGLAPGDYALEVATPHNAAQESVSVVDDGPDAGDLAGDVTLDVVPPEDVDVDVEVVETGAETTVTLQNDTATAAYAVDGLDASQNYTVVANASGYDEATASDVRIEAGETTDVDLTLQRQTGAAELVVAENASGDAVENATVDVGAFGDDDSTIASAATDANGSVDLQGLPVGEHAVAVHADGYDAASATIDVDAGQTATATVDLTALAPASFDVEIVDANATTAAGVNQTFTVEVENVGDREATQTLAVQYADDVVGNESITLAGGASTTETFVVDTDGTALGVSEVAVASDDDSDAVNATIGAERSVATDTAAPGETVEVTVGGELGTAANFTLIETYDPGFADSSIAILSTTVNGNPLPYTVQTFDAEGGLFVPESNAGPGTLEITYEVTVPDGNETSDGAHLGYDRDSSLFELSGQELPIVGDDGVTVDA